MNDPPPALPPRVFGVLIALERPFRFLVGMGLMVREVIVYTDPRPWVLIACATLSGTSLTALADEARRTLSRGDR